MASYSQWPSYAQVTGDMEKPAISHVWVDGDDHAGELSIVLEDLANAMDAKCAEPARPAAAAPGGDDDAAQAGS